MENGKRSERNRKKPKGNKKTGKKILIAIACLIPLLVGCGFFYVTNLLSKIEKVEVNKENLGIDESVDAELSKKYGDIQNIALFGIDQPAGTVGRSDAIMIATIDRGRKKVKITSIMRDSYVNIPGHGKDKINHAYAFGGPELAIRTINENFGLNIKDFAAVNFSSMPKLIDMVDGIEIQIDADEIGKVPGISSTGMHNLTGEQALAYSRIRYAEGGDYKRTDRQREVIDGLFNKLIKKPVTSYPTILSDMLPLIKSSLSYTDILSMASEVAKIGGNIEQDRFPRDGYCTGKMINNVYYLTYDEVDTKVQLHDWIFEDKK